MAVTGNSRDRSSTVISRRTPSESDALDGDGAGMHFLLAETLFELLAIAASTSRDRTTSTTTSIMITRSRSISVSVGFHKPVAGLREYAVTPPNRSVNSTRTRAKDSGGTSEPSGR